MPHEATARRRYFKDDQLACLCTVYIPACRRECTNLEMLVNSCTSLFFLFASTCRESSLTKRLDKHAKLAKPKVQQRKSINAKGRFFERISTCFSSLNTYNEYKQKMKTTLLLTILSFAFSAQAASAKLRGSSTSPAIQFDAYVAVDSAQSEG